MTGPKIPARKSELFSAQQLVGLVCALSLALFSVGGAAQDPDDGPGPGTVTITGSERLTWDQEAPSAAEIRTYRFVAYIDGNPVDLPDASCSTAPAGGTSFACSARFPPLTPGTHDIAVSAYVNPADRLSTYRSWPIRVYLKPAGSSALSKKNGELHNSSLVTSDGVQLRSVLLTTGLDDPTDLVTLPDRRVLIAERSGRIRVLRGGSLLPAPALTLTDVSTRDGGGLLALAADRDFESTRSIYALYTTASGLRLVRFTESNDSLSSAAILLEGLPVSPSAPLALLRMGPDRKLYVALDDGGDASTSQDLGAFSGKVIRVNVDGTTPADEGAPTPIFAIGAARPAAMEWSENGETLWLAQAGSGMLDQLRALPRASVAARAATRQRVALPSGIDATALVFYRSGAIPNFQGDLFVADAASASILRVRFDRDGTPLQTEWLFRGLLNSIREINAAADGSLYVSTAHTLVRIAAETLN
jgi:glucose/arabinose dehydrogenase